MKKNRDQGSEIRGRAAHGACEPVYWLWRQTGSSRLFPSLCVGLLLLIACGADAILHAQSAPDVHALAQRVDNHYNKLHSLRANFTESYEGLGMTRSESGTLLLLKPGRMRWDYSSPAGKVFLSDGKYAWFYTPGATQVQRIAVKQLDDLRSPLSFLLGHTQLEKEFSGLKLTQGPQGALELTGQPKGQENRVTGVILTVEPNSGAIRTIEIDEVDGSKTRFKFTGEEPNVVLPASTFHFTAPAGVPVVDGLPSA